MKKIIVGLLVASLLSSGLMAKNHSIKINTGTLEYKDENTLCEGYYAYPKKSKTKLPGVLIVHAWKGITDYEKRRAEEFAKQGYSVLVADIYGKGIRPQTPQEAGQLATQYKNNRNLLRQRTKVGLDALKSLPPTQIDNVAVLGYCFGGTAALELARTGVDLKAAISFHGHLDTPKPSESNIKAKVLVLHGADDFYVPSQQITDFEVEMRQHKVDWALVKFGNAVHAFSDDSVGNDTKSGAAYNALADKRSMKMASDFLAESLKP